ncbi:MAG: ribbon-helix-helix protein, CopG family [Pyrinomonadaceae bacterium]|jgi:metal-responsive CopG/Arc/MetJ family transcriptional regulator|nr:ribbon-helix-helix protein, CopG family [Pyrinomonadaceae bacterium]
METIQLTIEESLLAEAEQTARSLEMSRSDFIEEAVERDLRQREIIAMERKHAQGYARQPQASDEVGEWESEQEWGEP